MVLRKAEVSPRKRNKLPNNINNNKNNNYNNSNNDNKETTTKSKQKQAEDKNQSKLSRASFIEDTTRRTIAQMASTGKVYIPCIPTSLAFSSS